MLFASVLTTAPFADKLELAGDIQAMTSEGHNDMNSTATKLKAIGWKNVHLLTCSISDTKQYITV